VKSLRAKDSSQDSVFIQSDGRYLSRRRSVTHHRNRSEQQSRSSATATIAPFASYKPMAFPDASAAMRRCSVPKRGEILDALLRELLCSLLSFCWSTTGDAPREACLATEQLLAPASETRNACRAC
ncbi:hypothetical protein B296_00052778, partial [Ensete ventricosum]